jgi:hypothetical protein
MHPRSSGDLFPNVDAFIDNSERVNFYGLGDDYVMEENNWRS